MRWRAFESGFHEGGVDGRAAVAQRTDVESESGEHARDAVVGVGDDADDDAMEGGVGV